MKIRKYFCKHHNIFLSGKQIQSLKENRCYYCKHFVRVYGGKHTYGTKTMPDFKQREELFKE